MKQKIIDWFYADMVKIFPNWMLEDSSACKQRCMEAAEERGTALYKYLMELQLVKFDVKEYYQNKED